MNDVNNPEAKSDSTSGDVSEVESGTEVSESEMDDELSKELDGSFDSFISGNREAEIYANSFSMAAQDNKASCEFMQQHFPNTWEQFKKTL